MVYTDMNRVAAKIGNVAYADLATGDKERLLRLAEAIEQQLALPPYGFRMNNATITELLPRGPRMMDDVDLADFTNNTGGNIIPLDSLPGSTVLALSYTPVLLTGLTLYEDEAAYANQGSGAFGSATLLTQGVDYYLDCDEVGLSRSGLVHRIGRTWTRTPRAIKATYRGGAAAQLAASLGTDFSDVYEEVVSACVLHNYAFWKQQQESFESGRNGQDVRSESLGKFSQSLGAPSGMIGGQSFMFGSAPELLPGELVAPLSSYVNLGALLTR